MDSYSMARLKCRNEKQRCGFVRTGEIILSFRDSSYTHSPQTPLIKDTHKKICDNSFKNMEKADEEERKAEEKKKKEDEKMEEEEKEIEEDDEKK